MTRKIVAILAALLWCTVAHAQIGPGSGVQGTGTITPNDCAKWVGPGIITDAGTTCGGGAASGITIGTSVITGGTDTRVLFDDLGTIGESAGFTFTKGPGQLGLNGTATSGTSNLVFTGPLLTGAGTTNTLPQMLFQPTGTAAVTSWLTTGTALGFNLASGSTANIIDAHVGGAASVFSVASSGNVLSGGNIQATGSILAGGNLQSGTNSQFLWNGRGILTSPAAGAIQFGAADVASGAVAQIITFQGNTASTTTGPLALIRGAGGGSSTSVGGELRLSGGLSSAAAGTGGPITFYTAPAAAGNAAVLAMTIAASGAITGQGNITTVQNLAAGNIFAIGWSGRTQLLSSADGQLDARNNANSAYSFIRGKLETDTNYTAGVPVVTGYVTLYDATGTAYKVPACTGC